MTTANVVLVAAIKTLRAAGVDDPARDARVLLAHALNVSRDRLTLVMPDEITEAQRSAYERGVKARAARQPVAQIVGSRAFYGRDFRVTGDVLDPRPDTELLVDVALGGAFESVLDLGTGSGCILLTLLAEHTLARGVGADLSPAALAIAQSNLERLALGARAKLLQGSWFDALVGQTDAQFDLIVSNPPYITQDEMSELAPDVVDWEPHMALSPGGDGLDAYREITANAARYLTPKGRLIVEIGKDQADAVVDLFHQGGFAHVTVHKDLSGHDRVVAANRTQ